MFSFEFARSLLDLPLLHAQLVFAFTQLEFLELFNALSPKSDLFCTGSLGCGGVT